MYTIRYRVVDLYHQSVLIPCNVENRTVAFQHTGCAKLSFHVRRACPVCLNYFLMPRLQRSSRPWIPEPEGAKSSLRDDPHACSLS